MRYGLPYSASKNTIAEWVIFNLPRGNRFVDLFAGGCAVTHCAMLSGKYKYFLANDIGEAPRIFKMAINGEFENYATIPTREEFDAEKENDYILALVNSFGNTKKSYLWDKKVESVKVEASRMLSAPSQYERRIHYKKFIKELDKYIKSGETLNGIDRLESLERLQGLERLERLQGLERLEISNQDYRTVPLFADDVIYADPPYKNTSSACNEGDEFDYEQFEEWLNKVEIPVYVSEYTCPKGCVELNFTERAGTMKSGADKRTEEKLFVQERFADVAYRTEKYEHISLGI